MYKQLLFCLETNKKAATDLIYINETISRFYQLTNKEKLSQIYMGSKTKYNAKDITSKITKSVKDYTLGKTHVIFCIDVDDFESNPDHIREYNDIVTFCNQNQYELIWFCHDVEDVFLKKRISDHEKVKEAGAFRQRKGIESLTISSLTSSNNHLVHSSNIMSVLDKYLARK